MTKERKNKGLGYPNRGNFQVKGIVTGTQKG